MVTDTAVIEGVIPGRGMTPVRRGETGPAVPGAGGPADIMIFGPTPRAGGTSVSQTDISIWVDSRNSTQKVDPFPTLLFKPNRPPLNATI